MRHLVVQDALRPGVRHDVVQHRDEHVLLGPEPQQPRAQHRAAREIEGPARLRRRDLGDPGLALGLRQAAEVLHGQAQVDLVVDHLHRLAVGHGEGRAQHLVAAHDLAERALEHRRVQRAVAGAGAEGTL